MSSESVTLSRDVDEVLDVVEGLARKYQGVDGLDRDALRDYAGKQAALRLEVDRRVSWDHAKLSS